MAEITYESIRSTLRSAVRQGALMRCVFACPVTGTTVESSAGIHPREAPLEPTPASPPQDLWGAVYGALVAALRRVLGARRLLSADAAAASAASRSEAAEAPCSDEDERAAVVAAFRRVAAHFAWDGRRGQWIWAEAADQTDFARVLGQADLAQRQDRLLLARLLIEVANADGRISPEERAFLDEHVAPDLGPIEELTQRPSLTRAELEQTSQAGREAALMVAWAVALSDRTLDEAERAQLFRHADALGISRARAEELRRFAQRFIVDQALEQAYRAGPLSEAARAEVLALADSIGLPRDDAERVEAHFRQRNALV